MCCKVPKKELIIPIKNQQEIPTRKKRTQKALGRVKNQQEEIMVPHNVKSFLNGAFNPILNH